MLIDGKDASWSADRENNRVQICSQDGRYGEIRISISPWPSPRARRPSSTCPIRRRGSMPLIREANSLVVAGLSVHRSWGGGRAGWLDYRGRDAAEPCNEARATPLSMSITYSETQDHFRKSAPALVPRLCIVAAAIVSAVAERDECELRPRFGASMTNPIARHARRVRQSERWKRLAAI